MLPGHIGSTVATFYLLVTPILNMQLGLGFSDLLPKIRGLLDEKVTAKPAIDLVLPVKVYKQLDKYRVVPLKKHLSILKNLTEANGYAFVPAGTEKKKNEIIDVKIFGGLEFFNIVS
jgi:molybdopterin biosynthesis enzyme